MIGSPGFVMGFPNASDFKVAVRAKHSWEFRSQSLLLDSGLSLQLPERGNPSSRSNKLSRATLYLVQHGPVVVCSRAESDVRRKLTPSNPWSDASKAASPKGVYLPV